MRLPLLVYQLALILHATALNGWDVCPSHPTFREPANSDIKVVCGTAGMELEILLCPLYFGGYNESLVALNGHFGKASCQGTPNYNANPPVVKFNFSMLDDSLSACSNKVTIMEETGSGVFSDYSKVQYVNISGTINTYDPSGATIVYRQELMYLYSCKYPLQYLTNKTEASVSGVSLAIRDNNGSFISTLSMRLFQDVSYTSPLRVPSSGLSLKTRIFVEVRATNLTQRFNVLLDRCYATTSHFPLNSTYYDLFVGCNYDIQTVMGINGDSQKARFSFEAFRFVQDSNRTVSTYYVHCATRLCEKLFCGSLKQNCSGGSGGLRRRREVTSVSDTATVTSGPIITKMNNDGTEEHSGDSDGNRTVLGVATAAVLMGVFCIATIAAIFYRIHHSKTAATDKTILHH
ncbi:zona pellucida-like domain-containing protein 1 [Alosa sapidissima]|uniref:zona pellucida-like domain-containing protein 1 n=1 Tax=Alosa sapidissima TaxID=34773 RepID=UPI001C09103A|nr:zona pellucida-like domain-containing protein 1 [Alosa sapidissima]